MKPNEYPRLFVLMLPVAIVFSAFFLLPMAKLILIGGSGENGFSEYLTVFYTPRHFESLVATLILSASVTLAALVVSTISGVFLVRNRFPGRRGADLDADLSASLSRRRHRFSGDHACGAPRFGKRGLSGADRLAAGFCLFHGGSLTGYLYFSIPRVILTIMAAAEKLDPALEEAARSLGASRWQVVRDVILPALKPALIASGAIAFATAMGAFGTAFTLATNIDVLPMTIYTEFTLNANFATAAALSIVLGIMTWLALFIARSMAGSSVAASAA